MAEMAGDLVAEAKAELEQGRRSRYGAHKPQCPFSLFSLFPGVPLRGSGSAVRSSVPGTGSCLALARARAERKAIRGKLLRLLDSRFRKQAIAGRQIGSTTIAGIS